MSERSRIAREIEAQTSAKLREFADAVLTSPSRFCEGDTTPLDRHLQEQEAEVLRQRYASMSYRQVIQRAVFLEGVVAGLTSKPAPEIPSIEDDDF